MYTKHTNRLLKDKPNFVFEFRDALEFKNVPSKVKCYYLLDNKQKKQVTPVVDESDQIMYGFMIPMATPPSTPLGFNTPPFSPRKVAEEIVKSGASCPFAPVRHTPGINITRPSVPDIGRRSMTDSEFSYRSPTPESDPEEEDNGLQMKSVGTADKPSDLDVRVHQSSSTFVDQMRRLSGLTPVTEDDETKDSPDKEIPEGVVPTEGGKNLAAPKRKHSDASNASNESTNGGDGNSTVSKVPVRKVSNTSIESGIGSSTSKTSDASSTIPISELELKVQEENVRKSSASSGEGTVEEELQFVRLVRAGSVSENIKKFNTLTRDRQRRTGLDTTALAQEGKPPKITSPVKTDKDHFPVRPDRKSLDSIGSSGSND